jgi:hypothetical protein
MKLKPLKSVEQVEVSEAEIQKALESNLNQIEEGLRLVGSFVRIGIGVIDTLALDEDLCPVIIEFKKPGASDQDALIQALDYCVWCRENIDWLEEYIRKQKPDLLPQGQSLSEEVRIIIVAKDFEERTKRVAQAVEPEVKFVSYDFYEIGPDEVGIGFRTVWASEAEIMGAERPSVPPTLWEHFDRRPNLRPIFEELANRVKKEVDPEIDIDRGKGVKSIVTGIAFKRRVNYMYIELKRDHLKVFILGLASEPPSERINPLTQSWALTHRWGFVRLYRKEDVDDELLRWIKKAYNLAG